MAVTAFDYIATRNKIIEAAFRIVGVLTTGETLTGEQTQQGVDALQLLIKAWSNEHIFLWAHDRTSFTTQVDQEAYDSDDGLVGSDLRNIIGLDKAWVEDADGTEIPLEVISYSRYLEIDDKEEATGRPTTIAFRPLRRPPGGADPAGAQIYIYPSPDAIYTINALCVYPLSDLDSSDAENMIPVRFQKALKYCLAEDLLDEYPGPMNERLFIKGKAQELFTKAKRSDVAVETTNEVEGFFPNRRC